MIHPGVNDIDRVLSALAEPTRRRVIEVLVDGPRRASDLASIAGMRPTAMSRHLRVLRTTGVVEVESTPDDARERLYRLRPDAFVAMRAWLDQVQAFWSDQLGSFKAHADRRGGRR
jgi:DNA-binding transcriptional ArsR family regulator